MSACLSNFVTRACHQHSVASCGLAIVDAGRQTETAARVRRSPEAVSTHRLAGQWSRFEANHPAQRKLGFLVLIIAELEELHGAVAEAGQPG